MPETPQPPQPDSEPSLPEEEKKPAIYFGSIFSLPYPTPESPKRKIQLVGTGTGVNSNKWAIKPNPTEELYELIDPAYVIEHGSDFWPYEKLLPTEFEKRYEDIASILRRNNLESYSAFGREYPLPTLEQFVSYLSRPERVERIRRVLERDLATFHLVPICGVGDPTQAEKGTYASPLVKAVAAGLTAKFKAGKLLHQDGTPVVATKFNKFTESVPTPIYVNPNYSDLGYRSEENPKNFLSQEEFLTENLERSPEIPGWQLFFTEESPFARRVRSETDPNADFHNNLPASDRKKPLDFERVLERNPETYPGETVELALVRYLEMLDNETATVFNDYQVTKDANVWLLGNNFRSALGSRPGFFWGRGFGRLVLGSDGAGDADGSLSAAPAAR